MVAFLGNVEGYPGTNPDNLLLAMTSDNHGVGGCQFFNPYLTRADDDPLSGEALGNDVDLLRWIEFPMTKANDTDTWLDTVDFVVSGEAFDLPAGTVSMAIGAQYREEGRETDVNPQTIGSVNSFGQLAGAESVAGLSENREFDEDRDIWGAFVEFQIPVTETLEAQLAARYEDYGGDIGDTFNPKLGLRWQARESLVFRGSVGTSFRGPSLAQVEEGTGFSLEFGVVDKLGAGNAAIDGPGPNCVRTGQCELPSDAAAPRILIVKRGLPSPDLEPEEATTFNIGVIWEPVDGALTGLRVGLDYYNISFDDKIIDVPTQAFLFPELGDFQTAQADGDYVIVEASAANFGDACDPTADEFQWAGGGGMQEWCQVDPTRYADDSIQRRPSLGADLQIIRGNAINTGEVNTDGIDANFQYFRDFDFGSLLFSGAMNWMNEYEVKDFPLGIPDFDGAGYTNRDPEKRLAQSMPDLKGNLGVTYTRGNHNANLTMRYIGEYKDNAAPTQRLEDEFDAYYAFDARYTFTWNIGDATQLDLTIGAIDFTDEDVQHVRDSRGVDLTVVDQRGRRFYAGFSFRL
jgi:outer membrane receptor protein involved in Fe transport